MSDNPWDKILPLVNVPVKDRDVGLTWGELKQSHVGKKAKVAELITFGRDSWYNVFAGTIEVDENGVAFLKSLGNHCHYFEESFLVQIIEEVFEEEVFEEKPFEET